MIQWEIYLLRLDNKNKFLKKNSYLPEISEDNLKK